MLYTEKKSRLIHEVKLYDDVVFVRLVGTTDTKRWSLEDFEKNFDEYGGIHSNVYQMIEDQR